MPEPEAVRLENEDGTPADPSPFRGWFGPYPLGAQAGEDSAVALSVRFRSPLPSALIR
jgi:hypothetical protein